MKKILFMGDSITDSGRVRDENNRFYMGEGYPCMCAGRIMKDHPAEYFVENVGIGGHRIVDIYARIKKDFWNLKPDIFSMLIGINDVWHELGSQNGVEPERFEKVYRMLLEDTKKVLPDLKIILLEPFVLKARATEEKWEEFLEGTKTNAAIVKKLAEEFGCVFVPLQDKFDEACKLAPPDYWLRDGVHPSSAGHQLIADEWLKAFSKL